MRIHILGIGGTFMAGVALLAKEAGHIVSGSDMQIYPPMSTQLKKHNIAVKFGYDKENIDNNIDCIVVGNVIKRGNPVIEYVLAERIPYVSGPEWLAKEILKERRVIAVAGTHGKTTTASLLAWLLDQAGMQPGFLIGGIPENFGVSARQGSGPYFVVEADEYDCAFFDKRSKFLHYRPLIAILNNLEYDHADIFPDLASIQRQFHHFVRTIPGNGLIVFPSEDRHIAEVLEMGCWTPQCTFSGEKGDWQAKLTHVDGSEFEVWRANQRVGTAHWNLLGKHNVHNALAALAVVEYLGVSLKNALCSLSEFKNVKRRLEMIAETKGITIYDDFAHHPTAIATTLQGLRARIAHARLIVVLELGSHTMRMGVHKQRLQESLALADFVICQRPVEEWGLEEVLQKFHPAGRMFNNAEQIVDNLSKELTSGDHVVIMSNSGFGGIHQKLIQALQT